MQSKTHRIFLVWSFWSPLEGCTSIRMLPSKGSVFYSKRLRLPTRFVTEPRKENAKFQKQY